MTDEEVMACMTMFRSGKTKLAEFNAYLNEQNIKIILPSSIQFPKLYTLPIDEHTSVEPQKLTSKKLAVSASAKSITEKQYEHKLIACTRVPHDLTSDGFIVHLQTALSKSSSAGAKKTKIECYNKMAGEASYQYFHSSGARSVDATVPTGVPGVFADQLLVDIHAQSKFWNKLCITVETGTTGIKSGIKLGTLVQWRLEDRSGLKYLVANIWNMISGKMNIQQSTTGQDNSTATTKDITNFVARVLAPPQPQISGPFIVRAVDLTCHVPGGSDIKVQSSWVVASGPEDPRLSIVRPRLAFCHALSTREGETRTRTSLVDQLRRFVYEINDDANSVFTECNEDSSNTFKLKIVPDSRSAKHNETALLSLEFRSVPAILQRLLDDDTFLRTGESSFGISVMVHVLEVNESLTALHGNVKNLKKFGVCVCKYLYDKSNDIIDSIDRGIFNQVAFDDFYNTVHFLKIDKHAFMVNTSEGYHSVVLKSDTKRKTLRTLTHYDTAAKKVEEYESALSVRPTVTERDKLTALRALLARQEERKTATLESVDAVASLMRPSVGDAFLREVYDASGFELDLRAPAHYEVKGDESIKRIKHLISKIYAHCQVHPPSHGGKKSKTRRVKRNKSRNFRNKSRSRSKSRRTRRRVIKRKK
jgi:hypothetical protein